MVEVSLARYRRDLLKPAYIIQIGRQMLKPDGSLMCIVPPLSYALLVYSIWSGNYYISMERIISLVLCHFIKLEFRNVGSWGYEYRNSENFPEFKRFLNFKTLHRASKYYSLIGLRWISGRDDRFTFSIIHCLRSDELFRSLTWMKKSKVRFSVRKHYTQWFWI